MIKIRLQFSKSDTLRFIGHLDFLRVFQQTIRRAGLPAAFSQGFNPHLQISFALPLSLGMESVNDYADLTLEEEISATEIIKKLNAAAPNGLTIKNAYPAENKAASVVSVADYAIADCDFDKTKIEKILQSETIIIPKKTKKGIKDTEIRPDILSLEFSGKNPTLLLMRLSAGSSRFLNPVTVTSLLFQEKQTTANISRLELYRETEKSELIPL
jgi:radical SAM-linked protein